MSTFPLPALCLALFGVEWCGGEDDAVFLAAAIDGRDVGIGSDIDALGLQIVGPITVKALEVRESNHLGKIGEEGFGVVVPKFHIWVVEETLEDCAGDVCCLVACAVLTMTVEG